MNFTKKDDETFIIDLEFIAGENANSGVAADQTSG
jgi:hypothetical protein